MKADKAHMGRVAGLSCATCGDQPVQVHHIREGQGMAQRAGDWLTIPLCPSCHTGPLGVHGDKTMLKVAKKDELEILNDTLREIYG